MELAKVVGFPVREMHFGEEWLLEADSAFFTGTAAEVAGIGSINNIALKMNWEDSIGHTLAAMYRQQVMDNEYKHFTLV
jgi:branched-chain amino acid aminotransferase